MKTMNSLSIKQTELNNLIMYFDIQDIEKILSYAKKNNIIHEKTLKNSLEGIWADSNFDDIDIESEIRLLRKDVTKNLDKIESGTCLIN